MLECIRLNKANRMLHSFLAFQLYGNTRKQTDERKKEQTNNCIDIGIKLASSFGLRTKQEIVMQIKFLFTYFGSINRLHSHCMTGMTSL